MSSTVFILSSKNKISYCILYYFVSILSSVLLLSFTKTYKYDIEEMFETSNTLDYEKGSF